MTRTLIALLLPALLHTTGVAAAEPAPQAQAADTTGETAVCAYRYVWTCNAYGCSYVYQYVCW
jgi:hypothetical protein